MCVLFFPHPFCRVETGQLSLRCTATCVIFPLLPFVGLHFSIAPFIAPFCWTSFLHCSLLCSLLLAFIFPLLHSLLPFVGIHFSIAPFIAPFCRPSFFHCSLHCSLLLAFSLHFYFSSAFLKFLFLQSSHLRCGLPRFLHPSCFWLSKYYS